MQLQQLFTVGFDTRISRMSHPETAVGRVSIVLVCRRMRFCAIPSPESRANARAGAFSVRVISNLLPADAVLPCTNLIFTFIILFPPQD